VSRRSFRGRQRPPAALEIFSVRELPDCDAAHVPAHLFKMDGRGGRAGQGRGPSWFSRAGESADQADLKVGLYMGQAKVDTTLSTGK
jgi:hypothetical protein